MRIEPTDKTKTSAPNQRKHWLIYCGLSGFVLSLLLSCSQYRTIIHEHDLSHLHLIGATEGMAIKVNASTYVHLQRKHLTQHSNGLPMAVLKIAPGDNELIILRGQEKLVHRRIYALPSAQTELILPTEE